ncbi:MAG: LytTR family transcriptional regulator [Bacteroidaceae bacterium]|nr:LytTR family transcriptional regulator [Bacteroidaceae bacterium]
MTAKIPDYIFSRRFLFLTVPFITLFSVLFLLLYSPFSSTYWLTLSTSYLLLGTAVLYAVSVLFLLLSKFLLIEINRKRTLGLPGILVYFISEVLVISLFYTVISILVNKCQVNPWLLFMKSFFCVFLILVIPYTICILYGYVHGLRLQLDGKTDKTDDSHIVSIHDNNGKTKLSIMVKDILYAVSEDNYVKIFYEQDGQVRKSLIRTTAKNIEDDLEGSITRCHRSYLVNIRKVRFFNNDRDNLYVLLDNDSINPIPVSRSYRDAIANMLSR